MIINKRTKSREKRKVWYRGGTAGSLVVSESDSTKSIFKVSECGKVEAPLKFIEGRAPWMEIAWKEFETYKGLREEESPLKEKIPIYFEVSSAKGLNYNHKDPWCGAYIVWCFEQTEEYKKVNTPKSAAAFGWLSKNWQKGEDCEPFIGATIIFDFSHVAFIVGENIGGIRYVYLGGNQGNGDKRSGYQKISMGSIPKNSKKILGITKPKIYLITEEDKKLPKYDVNAENSKASSR